MKVKIDEPGKIVKIGTQVTEQTKDNLVNFLKSSFDMMANSLIKMNGVSKEVIKHKLNIKK